MSTTVSVIVCILSIIVSIILAALFLPTKKRDQLTGFSAWLHDLFNFRTLVIEKIFKYLYILSTCVCIIGGFFMMVSAVFSDYNVGQQLLTGLLTLVLGPIAVRIVYEVVMMFILLVTNVLEINKKMKNQPDGEPAPAKTVPTYQQPAYRQPTYQQPIYQAPVPERFVFCTRCGTKYDANKGNCPSCGKQ